MITRKYPDILSAYTGLTDELAYPPSVAQDVDNVMSPNYIPENLLKWGVCVGFPGLATIRIEDILKDDSLHLGMASFTKSRWTRFLRRYFRPDLLTWVAEAMAKLNRYPSRPFVASYSLNLNTGHNYGGCLSSLQIRISPKPEVILYSRACQIDKIGFLDLCLIHKIAQAMGVKEVKGTWVVSLGFISGISQTYYLKRFNRPVEGHRLQRTLSRLNSANYEDIKFGPLKRSRKRMMALDELGEIPRSVPVSALSLNFDMKDMELCSECRQPICTDED